MGKMHPVVTPYKLFTVRMQEVTAIPWSDCYFLLLRLTLFQNIIEGCNFVLEHTFGGGEITASDKDFKLISFLMQFIYLQIIN